jgi:hypothetical protein
MICYRDMTFCSYAETCNYAKYCPRALTPEVQADADKWWEGMPGNAPICTFVDKPQCHSDYDQNKDPDGRESALF